MEPSTLLAMGIPDPPTQNGNVIVTGGTIKLTGQSGFDFDGTYLHRWRYLYQW